MATKLGSPSVTEPVDASRMVQTAVRNIRERLEQIEQAITVTTKTSTTSSPDLSSQLKALAVRVTKLEQAASGILVQVNGAAVGVEDVLNLIAGTGIVLTGVSDVANARVNVTFSVQTTAAPAVLEQLAASDVFFGGGPNDVFVLERLSAADATNAYVSGGAAAISETLNATDSPSA